MLIMVRKWMTTVLCGKPYFARKLMFCSKIPVIEVAVFCRWTVNTVPLTPGTSPSQPPEATSCNTSISVNNTNKHHVTKLLKIGLSPLEAEKESRLFYMTESKSAGNQEETLEKKPLHKKLPKLQEQS